MNDGQDQNHSILQHDAIGERLIGQGFTVQQNNDPKQSSTLCMKWQSRSTDCHSINLDRLRNNTSYFNDVNDGKPCRTPGSRAETGDRPDQNISAPMIRSET